MYKEGIAIGQGRRSPSRGLRAVSERVGTRGYLERRATSRSRSAAVEPSLLV